MTSRGLLDGPQFAQLKELFDTALSLPPEQWEDFIRDSTGGDSLLHSELSSLLAAHEKSEGYFENLAGEIVIPAFASLLHDEAAEADPVSRNVSHYELIERIGGGGMGVVYKARDTRLGRTVALKFLPRHHAGNPAARTRLVAEARAASRLDHPNIGVVYEIGEASDGQQFIAMAWYDGETLRDRIRRATLPVREAVTVGSQLGSALAAAHAAGIVHRDVKPANVIVTRSGAIKLVDFGIAKLMTEDDGERHLGAGTVAYMSPEQSLNMPLDARSDIWSLGVLLYEIIAGTRPFRGEDDERVVSAIRNEEPAPITSIRSDVPGVFADIIARCLKKNRDDRFQSAEQFCDALGSLEQDASPPGEDAGELRHASVARTTARRAVFFGSAAVLIAISAWAYSQNRDERSALNASPPTTVAVLPFTAPDTGGGSSYLVEGLADDLREELGGIGPVAVPGYLSSTHYAATRKPITVIAHEMNARFVVTGVVRRSSNGPRVDLGLFDGRTGASLWARTYVDSDSVPADITRAATRDVLSTLDVKLAKEDNHRLRSPRMRNRLAYDLYLRGRYEELSGIPRRRVGDMPVDNVRRSQAFYSQVRSLDPGFAASRARLAMSHIRSAAMYDTTRARLDQARVEAESALRLEPKSAEAHQALAAYWVREGKAEESIAQLELGLHSLPNHVDLLLALGQRYMETGRWEDGIAKLKRAASLDPLNPLAWWRLATGYGRLRRNDEGMKAFNRLIELSPEDHEIKLIKGHSYLRWKGSADTLDAMLDKVPRDWDVRGIATLGRYVVYRVHRRYREGLSMLDSAKSELSLDGLVYYPKSLMIADFYHALGEEPQARVYYEAASIALSDSAAAHPRDASIHAALGLAYAGLGRRDEAISAAQRAIDLSRVAANARNATAMMGLAVETFGRVGELDRAFEIVELLLTMPSGREITLPFLRVWPGFDPLRGDPRFAELVKRFTVGQ